MDLTSLALIIANKGKRQVVAPLFRTIEQKRWRNTAVPERVSDEKPLTGRAGALAYLFDSCENVHLPEYHCPISFWHAR